MPIPKNFTEIIKMIDYICNETFKLCISILYGLYISVISFMFFFTILYIFSDYPGDIVEKALYGFHKTHNSFLENHNPIAWIILGAFLYELIMKLSAIFPKWDLEEKEKIILPVRYKQIATVIGSLTPLAFIICYWVFMV